MCKLDTGLFCDALHLFIVQSSATTALSIMSGFILHHTSSAFTLGPAITKRRAVTLHQRLESPEPCLS